jgi:hypothetical protein
MSAETVFISYSQESPEHSGKVRGLGASLSRDGCECRLDVYKDTGEDWPTWMTRQLTEVDFIICVVTKIYERRFREKELPDAGLGVGWEAPLIRRLLYGKKLRNDRIFPVFFDAADRQFVPLELQGYDYFQLDGVDGYEALLRKVLKRPPYSVPAVGTPPILGTLATAPLFARPGEAPSSTGTTIKAADISRLNEAKTGLGELEAAAGNQPSIPPSDSTVRSVLSQSPTHTAPPAADTGIASLQPETSDKQPPEDKTPEKSGSQPPGVSWSSVLRTSLTILFFAAIALFWAYTAVFGPTISMVVQDLDWEPRSPKPGEMVKFTAKFASTYTVRQFAGAHLPRIREVEGKRSAHTFTETWSIAGADFKKDRVEVLESGRVTTSQIERVFDRPGSYRVKFSLSVQRDDHRNEIIRTIWVGDN